MSKYSLLISVLRYCKEIANLLLNRHYKELQEKEAQKG